VQFLSVFCVIYVSPVICLAVLWALGLDTCSKDDNDYCDKFQVLSWFIVSICSSRISRQISGKITKIRDPVWYITVPLTSLSVVCIVSTNFMMLRWWMRALSLAEKLFRGKLSAADACIPSALARHRGLRYN